MKRLRAIALAMLRALAFAWLSVLCIGAVALVAVVTLPTELANYRLGTPPKWMAYPLAALIAAFFQTANLVGLILLTAACVKIAKKSFPFQR